MKGHSYIKSAILVGALALMSSAYAQQTWDYTGQVMQGGGSAPVYDVLSGDIVLATALNPNEADQIVTPQSYSFDETGLQSSLATPGGGPSGTFEFSTVNGQITSWEVLLSSGPPSNSPDGSLSSQLWITTYGDAYQASFTSIGCSGPNGSSQCYNVSEGNNAPGSWVDPPSASEAPEINPAAAGAGLTLLIGMVLVARGRRAQQRRLKDVNDMLQVSTWPDTH